MEEIDNQTDLLEIDEASEEEYILPEGYNEETGEIDEIVEEAEEETTDEEVETDEAEEEETTIEPLEELEIKYLHESTKLKDIPREELQSLTQKGMNYDKIQEKLSLTTEQNEEFKAVADMFEMDIDSLLDTLKQQYFDDKANKESRNVEDVKKEYNSNRKDSQQKAIDRFVAKYPDVPVDKLTQDVLDRVARGDDMTNAYETSVKDADIKAKGDEIKTLTDKIAELEKQLKVGKQNSKTKKKGVVKPVSGEGEKSDDFLDGLYGK